MTIFQRRFFPIWEYSAGGGNNQELSSHSSLTSPPSRDSREFRLFAFLQAPTATLSARKCSLDSTVQMDFLFKLFSINRTFLRERDEVKRTGKTSKEERVRVTGHAVELTLFHAGFNTRPELHGYGK